MFQHTHVADIAGYDIPLAAARSLFSPSSPKASFRIQRLGSYLVSNLFAAEYMAESEFVHEQRLVTLCRGKKMFFTGARFDQWDLDVLLYCALTAPVKNGKPVQFQFSPVDLLRALNLRNSPSNRDRVFTSLLRLHTGVIDIRGSDYRYMTRLMNRVLVDAAQERCLVEINEDVTASFRMGDAPLQLRDRRALGRNGLAKWLHGVVMVFTGGFTSDIEGLHSLCRPAANPAPRFAAGLEGALDLLEDIGVVESRRIDGSRVRVVAGTAPASNATCGVFSRGACV